MAEAIKAGDFVMVINGHCKSDFLGRSFTVSKIVQMDAACTTCKKYLGLITLAAGLDDWFLPLPWLLKINPPALTESTTMDEKITA